MNVRVCLACESEWVIRYKDCPFSDDCEKFGHKSDCSKAVICKDGKIMAEGCTNEKCECYVDEPGHYGPRY